MFNAREGEGPLECVLEDLTWAVVLELDADLTLDLLEILELL